MAILPYMTQNAGHQRFRPANVHVPAPQREENINPRAVLQNRTMMIGCSLIPKDEAILVKFLNGEYRDAPGSKNTFSEAIGEF